MRGPPARHPEEPREQFPAVEGIITDASELKPGDRVVYPNQGVCEVVGSEDLEIGGVKHPMIRVRKEEDGAIVRVAVNKIPTVGLRRVASKDQIEGVFHYLAAQFDDPELDWKVRHRDNADRLMAGGVLGVAEVVKGLHSLSRLRPLPTKEREQYDNARHLLVHEVAVSLAVPAGVAEDYIDYALMPPAGVKFELKPPPKPVVLPQRPKRPRPAAQEETDELGLDELGLPDLSELGIEGEAKEEKEEGGEGEAGAEGEGAEAPAAAAEEAPPPKAKKAGPPKPKPAREARKAPEAKEKPAKKAAAKKEKAPARKEKEKAAPRKAAAKKPAPKRGGKKR